MALDPTLREVHRILRSGGRFAALWNPRVSEGDPLHAEIEAKIAELAPGVTRVSSGASGITATLTESLLGSGLFEDVVYLEGRHVETRSPAQYVGVWESVNDVRVLLGGMANEELFFGEEGTTNGAHNDITRVTKLLHHAVAEMGMYRKTRLNFGALIDSGNRTVDEETRSIMEMQSERLYVETKATLARLKPLTEHLAGKLMDQGEMSLKEALYEIRSFEAACFSFNSKVGLNGAATNNAQPAPHAAS